MIRTYAAQLALLIALLPGVAFAQVFKWKDPATGKTVISDAPQPGSAAARQRARAAAKLPAEDETPATDKAKTAAAPVKPVVDPELEKRRIAQEEKERAEQAAQEKKRDEALKKDCAGARQNLFPLKSGERIALRDNNGERYFMEDAQRAQEIARHEAFISENCAGR
jgi:hypothetical protein